MLPDEAIGYAPHPRHMGGGRRRPPKSGPTLADRMACATSACRPASMDPAGPPTSGNPTVDTTG
jgi:hypothetical protein